MVTDPNAVIDPGAVVVEPLDAVAADGAVPAATRPNRVAVRAELGCFNIL